jgi:hypothetical protein
MSAIDIFFDTDKKTCVIPCDIPTTRDLRVAAQDCQPETGRVKVDPVSGVVRAYSHDEGTVWIFDCSEREGERGIAIAQVLIGLGRYARSLIAVPACLTDRKASAGEQYWIDAPEPVL